MKRKNLRQFDSEIVRRYLSGESSESIGVSLGTHDSSIDYRLKINGVKKRSISDSNKGRAKSVFHRKSLSESRINSGVARGEKNPNWKGGVQDKWSNLKNSQEYKNWRNSVYTRDGYSCMMCGDGRGGNLQAHHIYPRRDYPYLDLSVENGVTLCKSCHKRTIYKEYDFIALFENASNSVKPSPTRSVGMVIPSQA